MGIEVLQDEAARIGKPSPEFLQEFRRAVAWAAAWNLQYEESNVEMSVQLVVCFKTSTYSVAVTHCCGAAQRMFRSHSSFEDMADDIASLWTEAREASDRNHALRDMNFEKLMEKALASGAVVTVDRIDPNKVN